MRTLIIKCVLAAVALAVVGPIAGFAVGLHRGVDGGGASTMLVGSSVFAGVVGHVAALLLALGLGLTAARLTTARYGLFTAGLVLVWAAGKGGAVEDLLRSADGTGVLTRLAVEGVATAALGGALAWAVCRDGGAESPETKEKALSAETAIGLVAALLVGGLAVWLAARDDLKGQTIGAAAIGGALGATAARVVAHRSAGWAVVAGVAALGAVGPLLAMRLGADQAAHAMYGNAIGGSAAALGRVAPMDYLAGALLGAPIGMAWAGSMVEKRAADGKAGKADGTSSSGGRHPAGAAGRTQAR